jgi:hypothetical protein
MKKILTAILACVLVLSMVACTKAPVENNEVENNEEVAATFGGSVYNVFKANVAEDKTAEEIANAIVASEILPFAPMVMPIEAGLLPGFDNYEVKGFSEGYMFGPMMGSIAFVGYVFELPADADVEAFKTGLSENANLRWNICVEAEEMVIDNVDNKVFFVMCPTSFEEPEMPEDEMIDDEMLVDEDTEVVGGETEEEAEVLPPVAEEGEENLDNEISADAFEVE